MSVRMELGIHVQKLLKVKQSFSPRFYKFECNKTSDWLSRMV